jgi:RHS repeat-associated protein
MKNFFNLLVVSTLTLSSVSSFAATNLRSDSYDVYEAEVISDGYDDLIFIAKEKILIIASDIAIPIKYKDGEDFLLKGTGSGYELVAVGDLTAIEQSRFYNYAKASNLVTDIAFADGDVSEDGKSDLIIKRDDQYYVAYGSSGDIPSSFTRLDSIGGLGINGGYTVAAYTQDNRRGYKVTDPVTGQYWTVDDEGIALNVTRSPKSTTINEKFSGSFQVTPSGAATYSVPIDLPEGPRGVKPQVSLNYNSQRGNGLLGQGWSLAATESISRCSQLKPYNSTLQFDEGDAFCLNGQRLIKVAGDYGEADSLYRTEIDSGVLVKAHGAQQAGPLYFTVHTDKGELKEFGYTGDSRIEVAGSSTHVRSWMLNKVTSPGDIDRDYTYTEDGSLGQHYLKTIVYGINTVKFNWEERPDRSFKYSSGYKVSRTKRLKSVSVMNIHGSLFEYVVGYGYNVSKNRSYVQWLQKCSGTNCWKNISFDWEVPASTFYASEYNQKALYSKENQQIRFGDINGDGRTDLLTFDRRNDPDNRFRLYYGKEGSLGGTYDPFGSVIFPIGWGRYYSAGVHLEDVDGDGLSDIINNLTSGEGMGHHLNYRVTRGDTSLTRIEFDTDNDARNFFADISGDGRADLIEIMDGKARVTLASNTGLYNTGSKYTTIGSFNWLSDNFRFIDLNGDGKDDLVKTTFSSSTEKVSVKIFLASSSSIGYFSQGCVYTDIGSYSGWVSFPDLNGDGLPDMLYKKKNTVTLKVDTEARLNLGKGCFSGQAVITKGGPQDLFVDINKDGLADRLSGSSPMYVFLGYGNGGFQTVGQEYGFDANSDTVEFDSILSTPFGDQNQDGFPDPVTFADVNGDGESEVIAYQSTGADYIYVLKGNSTRLSINSITDGFDQQTTISTTQMTDSTVYTRQLPSNYASGERQVMTGSMWLVSQVQHPNNITTNYRYSGAFSDEIRGFKGFNTVISATKTKGYTRYHNSIQSTVNLTAKYLNQTFPYTGRPDEIFTMNVKKSDPAAVIQGVNLGGASFTATYDGMYLNKSVSSAVGTSSAIYDWRSLSPATGTYFVYPFGKSTYQYDFQNSVTAGDPEYPATPLNEIHESRQYVDAGAYARLQSTVVTEGLPGATTTTTTTLDSYKTSDGYGGRASYLPTQTTTTTTVSGSAYASVPAASTSLTLTTTYDYDATLALTKLENGSAGVSGDSMELTTDIVYTGNDKVTSIYPKDSTRYGIDGERSSFEYYVANTPWLETEINALGHTVDYSGHNKWGLPSTIAQAGINGLSKTLAYDSIGRVTYVQEFNGQTANITRDFCGGVGGGLNSVVGCNDESLYYTYQKVQTSGQPTQYRYFDRRGRLTKEAIQSFDVTQYSVVLHKYDDLDRETETSIPVLVSGLSSEPSTSYWKKTYYDYLNRIVRIERPDGGYTSYDYDFSAHTEGYQRTVATVGSETRTEVELYSANGQLLQVIAPSGAITRYHYDAAGNPVIEQYSVPDYSDVTNAPEAITANFSALTKGYDLYGNLLYESDPNKGRTDYTYTAFGQVETIATPNIKAAAFDIIELQYDALGRQVREYRTEGTSCWYYDDTDHGYAQGQLTTVKQWANDQPCSSANDPNYQLDYDYNAQGLAELETIHIEGAPGINGGDYYITRSFENDGRLKTLEYPSLDLKVETAYTDSGYFEKAFDADNASTIYEQVTSMDARGNITGINIGSVSQTTSYKASSGQIQLRTAAAGGTPTQILRLEYAYNQLGNLMTFNDTAMLDSDGNTINQAVTYSMEYNDAAKRQLTRVAEGSATKYSYSYDALGNIVNHHENGRYYYSGGQPHQIASIPTLGRTYTYDLNGNVENDGLRSFVYTSFDKPKTITQNNLITEYTYGPNYERLYRKDNYDGQIRETWTIGGIMDVVKEGDQIEHHHLISANTTETHVKETPTSGVTKSVVHSISDHLGNVVLRFNESGQVLERLRYSPFGEIEYHYSAITLGTITLPSVGWDGKVERQGYGGHEHLFEMGLVHMGGRVYDPTIGRMLQGDIVVQRPKLIQSYNRYAYAWNNPYRYTDPTGYVFEDNNYEDDPTLGQLISPEGEVLGTYDSEGNFTSSDTRTNTSNSWDPNAYLGWEPLYLDKEEYVGLSYEEVFPAIDVDKAVEELNKNAEIKSTGWCAKFVRWALEAGGMFIPEGSRPAVAKNYGGVLQENEFKTIPLEGYSPEKGDVVVFEPYSTQPSQAGHIQMFNGERWVSDFNQRKDDLNNRIENMYPGPSYRNEQVDFTIYRP